MKIGILSLQGAVAEHIKSLEKLGFPAIPVKTAAQIKQLDALIIPGGESTTIGKLIDHHQLVAPITELARCNAPILGICAGLILLAKEIIDSNQPRLALMDIQVIRNAFGRQINSFETDLPIPAIGKAPFRAVFIRAPYIKSVGKNVEILAKFEDKIVLAQQNHILACAFHPELTPDLRIHKYFIDLIKAKK